MARLLREKPYIRPDLLTMKLQMTRFLAILATLFLISTFQHVALAQDGGDEVSKLNSVSGLPLPRFATLKSDNVYMRTGPSMDYPIRWIYKRDGLPVEIIQEFDAWRRIKDPEGETGWVHKILLSGKKTAMIKGKERVLAYASDELVRPIAKLEPDFIVTLEKCDKRACFATFPPYEGWIEKKSLWGVYASEIFN
jgi:SH3-like domain-containing protein